VGGDGVLNVGNPFLGVALALQEVACGLRREPRRLRPVGRVLRAHHAVVQPGGGDDHVHLGVFLFGEAAGRGHHALDVGAVMSGVRLGGLFREEVGKPVRPEGPSVNGGGHGSVDAFGEEKGQREGRCKKNSERPWSICPQCPCLM